MLELLRRAARGILSALIGWLVACVVTVPFQLVELGRNAAPAHGLLNLLQGLALWAAFTGAVCVTSALVIAAPAAIVCTAASVRRYRWLIVLVISGLAIYQIGKRLGTWDAFSEGTAHNPFASPLFWMYSIFAAVFTFVTVFLYGRQALTDH
jgi:hypothetical protein